MVENSKIIIWCKIMENAILLCLVCTPVLSQVFNWLQAGDSASIMGGVMYKDCERLPNVFYNPAASALSDFLRDCIISLILWQFYKVFNNIRKGEVFNQQQIKRFYFSGLCFIALSAYSIISDMYLSVLQSPQQNLQYYLDIDNFLYIPIGIGLVIFSYVLQLAMRLKEEQELVI